MDRTTYKSAYIAPNATVTGDVTLGENVSIWYGSVLRGDCGAITVGDGTNIQDNCILHSETTIGKGCTIGHGAIVHGCTVGDHSMVGMGAIVMTGAKIGSRCIVGAGAVVKENMEVPDGHVVLGVPARVVTEIRPDQLEKIYKNERDYVALASKTFG